jgi:hypothetical protein
LPSSLYSSRNNDSIDAGEQDKHQSQDQITSWVIRVREGIFETVPCIFIELRIHYTENPFPL